MSLSLPEEKYDNVTIYAQDDCVYLKGEIDQQAPAKFLDGFFDKVLAADSTQILIDVTDLDYINSSGIGCMLVFMMKLKAKAKITIKIDVSKNWQRKSFQYMQSVDPAQISLVEK